MLKALTTLLIFQIVGEAVVFTSGIAFPGPVLGMVALLAYLLAKPAALEGIKPTALDMLRHLSLLFVPAGVGIMLHGERLKTEGWKLAIAVLVSTVVTLAVTAWVTRWAINLLGTGQDKKGPTP